MRLSLEYIRYLPQDLTHSSTRCMYNVRFGIIVYNFCSPPSSQPCWNFVPCLAGDIQPSWTKKQASEGSYGAFVFHNCLQTTHVNSFFNLVSLPDHYLIADSFVSIFFI